MISESLKPMLQIYNTLSKCKEELVPIEPGKIRMYVCGMTVYDYCHIGHARMVTVFDMVYRYLRFKGFDVVYARNITDVDDKIIKRANENNEPFEAVVERFIKAMYEDFDALSVLRPDYEPRATQTIPQIVAMIETLIEKGYAYVAENNDVYYSVALFDGYGKLSGKQIDELQAGSRVEVEEKKKDPLDFALWKAAKPGEPAWGSPWGQGRPGWHIECSAMSNHILGSHFDIHGGGQDLQFPHHENEIAQSEACNDGVFANYWIHNGFVRVNEEKMSKSLDNFFIIRDVLKLYKAEELRYFLLSSHYRSQLNYSDEQLNNARAGLTRLYTALRNVEPVEDETYGAAYKEQFLAAMDDDFNTPEAYAVLFEVANQLNKLKASNSNEVGKAGALLVSLASVLGVLQLDPDEYLKGEGEDDGDEIEALIAQRNQARQDKNWAESDRIRDLLAEKNIVLEDGAGGTTWRKA